MIDRRLMASLLAAALTFTCLLAAGSAGAHTKRYGTQLTFAQTNNGKSFEGTVSSGKARCVANRQVSVLAGTVPLGTTSTNQQGQWRLDVTQGNDRIAPGSYSALVKKRKLPRRGHKHSCKAAQLGLVVLP